jgi:hypothetical protein
MARHGKTVGRMSRRRHAPLPGKAAQYASAFALTRFGGPAVARKAGVGGALLRPTIASYRVSTTFWRSICSEQKRTVDLQWGQQMESAPEAAIRRFGFPPGKRAF